MSYNADGMLTADGQVMIPNSIRERLGIKAGDKLPFHLTDLGELSVTPICRRSIFECLDELQLRSVGRPVTDEDINAAVGAAMAEQELPIRRQRRR